MLPAGRPPVCTGFMSVRWGYLERKKAMVRKQGARFGDRRWRSGSAVHTRHPMAYARIGHVRSDQPHAGLATVHPRSNIGQISLLMQFTV